jgi:hypothetical protein
MSKLKPNKLYNSKINCRYRDDEFMLELTISKVRRSTWNPQLTGYEL